LEQVLKCLDPQAKLGRFVEANNRPDDSSVDQGANTRANKEANFRFGSIASGLIDAKSQVSTGFPRKLTAIGFA
jgi:hypothetical protein